MDCSYHDDVRRFENTGDPYFLALIDSDACCIRQHVGAKASFFGEVGGYKPLGKVNVFFSQMYLYSDFGYFWLN
jgi:hypothetical protein